MAACEQDAAAHMPYGDFACLDVRQRVAVLRALINLVLATEDVHEYMQARAAAREVLELYHHRVRGHRVSGLPASAISLPMAINPGRLHPLEYHKNVQVPYLLGLIWYEQCVCKNMK